MSEGPVSDWRFCRIGLLVTGKGEKQFLPRFLRSLTTSGRCTFTVLGRIGQRSPITSEKRLLKMVGSNKKIADKDAQQIGLPARRWLNNDNDNLLLVVDDLEHARRDSHREVFGRYRSALDTILCAEGLRARASVHFLVNMLEAYFFGDVAAVNAVLGTELTDHQGDVEDIRHPKRDLQKLCPGFDEIEDGEAIVKNLDVERVLDNPAACGSLRVLFAWCAISVGSDVDARFRLDCGGYDIVTGPQLAYCA